MSALTSNQAVNSVVKSLFLLLLLLNVLTSITNLTFMALLWVDFDFSVLRQFQYMSAWSLLTQSTIQYEVSRLRYYYAKHAFRIHKLHTGYITVQVGQFILYTKVA